MIQTSTAYQRKIALDGRRQKVSLLVVLRNSYTYSFSNEDVMEGGISLSDGTSEQNSLSVGSFISRCLTVKLYNFDGRLAESQFEGSTVSIKVGLVMEDATEDSAEKVEWVYPGTFYTGEHAESGGIITLTAYDESVKFDRKYDSALQYPATLYQILWDACKSCGVELANVYFANMDYVVTSRPSDSATTYADIVSYAAQLAGCWARINSQGQLVLGWYDTDEFYPESGNTVDGGNFSDYSQADALDGGKFYPEGEAVDGGTLLDCTERDSADGGSFSDYSQAKMLNGGDFFDYGRQTEDAVTGGVFRQGLSTPVTISSLASCTVPTEDVRITGVAIIPKDDKAAPVMQGTDDYVISIKDNPLAQGSLGWLLDGIAKQLVDFQFRPMEVSAWDNPSIEAGDVAYLIDPKGNRYKTIISNLTYEFGNYEKFSADAESKSDNQASLHSNSEKSTAALRADTGKAIDETNGKVDSLASNTAASVSSINGNINLLQANKVDTDFLQANYLTAKDIKADYATVNSLTAATARISTLEVSSVTADYLKTNYMTANDIESTYATVENLNATNARIDSITTSAVTAEYLKAHYADIDLANIASGTIKTAMIDTGAVGTAQIADGSITDAKIVELTADKITAGTLSVEHLVITGSDKSIVYAINDANGTAQLSQTTVDGGSLTQRSITADRIVAGAITAKEIAAGTITADKLAAGSITAESGVIGSIDASKITTGTISADRIDTTNLKAQRIYSTDNNTYAKIGTVSFEDQTGIRSGSGITLYSESKYHGGVVSTYDSSYGWYDWITMSDASGENRISFGQDAITTASPANTLNISSGINNIFMTNYGRSGDGISIGSSGPILSIQPNGIYRGAEDWDDGTTNFHYHKYDDGTLIWWGYSGGNYADVSTAYGSTFWKKGWTLTISTTSPAFVGNRHTNVTITSSGLLTALNERVDSDGKTLIFDIQSPLEVTNIIFGFSYLIVGRWK
mgnify:FL=1